MSAFLRSGLFSYSLGLAHPYCNDILLLKIYFFVLGQVSLAGVKELSLALLDSVQASEVMRGSWE